MDILELLQGFWTWQTPVSFLGGVGAHQLWTTYFRDRRITMLTEKADGTYRYSTRFWIYTIIATLIICWIGYRTQHTANQVEEQAANTAQFAEDTNRCLADVVAVLTTRVGYNEALANLDKRRQVIWEQLVDDLASADNSAGLSQDALARWRVANTALKEDQAALTAERNTNTYPDCPHQLADK